MSKGYETETVDAARQLEMLTGLSQEHSLDPSTHIVWPSNTRNSNSKELGNVF